jgi:hypothetical protein
VIRPLTKSEFINIATNGIYIKLYKKDVSEYIGNLVRFIEETSHDYYISDYDSDWCEIAKGGSNSLRVKFENENSKINFYLPSEVYNSSFEKKSAGIAIKIVYMHSVAWEAINNDGEVNQTAEPWPL